MSRFTVHRRTGVPVAATIVLALQSGHCSAADQDEELDQVVVTGNRAGRNALDSNVPVDVVSEKSLLSVFSPDINYKLEALIPTYNVRRIPNDDGSIFVRPATLRNLSPDHTLVLLNGKRYHRSAFVDIAGGVRGSQAPDLSMLPSLAFKRVEVLRDGAAAQYGSDAIAGVVNFILDDTPGSQTYAQYGGFTKGDGETLQLGGSTGLQLGSRGHLNLSAEYVDGKASNNGIQRPQATLIEASGEPYASAIRALARDGVVQRYGQPDLKNLKLFANTSFEFGENMRLYAFGNFTDQTGVGDFNYRASLDVTGPDADGNTSNFSRNGGYTIKNSNGFASSAYNDTWRLIDVYPGGFRPVFGSDTRDFSLVSGVQGKLGSDFNWDLSASIGSDRIQYWMKDSINLSLGPDSPTDFPDAGSREQREQDINLDLNYRWQTGLANPVNVNFGLEYRHEQFRVHAGEEASWAIGPLRDMSSGSNGFVAALPGTAGVWGSHSIASYMELDADVTGRLNLALAGRIEDYPEFGTTTVGKLSARFGFSEAISLRGAVGTGFRAPTAGQQNLYNVSQGPNLNPDIPRSVNVVGQLPSTSPLAILLGGTALRPETSVNLSLGVVLQPAAGTSITIDAYRIDIDDRLGSSSTFVLDDPASVTPTQLALIRASGEPFATELTHIDFFTNNFDTRTTGVDLVAAWRGDTGPGRLGLTWAANYNRSKYRDYDPALIGVGARARFLRSVPRFASHLSAEYEWSNWTFTGRARHFGSWLYNSEPLPQTISPETFIDLVATWSVRHGIEMTLGIENVLDNYADKIEAVTVRNTGRLYPPESPYENNGRLAYARLGVKF